MAIFHCYVSSPEGIQSHLFLETNHVNSETNDQPPSVYHCLTLFFNVLGESQLNIRTGYRILAQYQG